MSKKNENGTLEVVLCGRVNGRIAGGVKPVSFKAQGGIEQGGGEWIEKKATRYVSCGIPRVRQGDKQDQFLGEGDYAPSPE